jgi:hypothetical protein
MLGQRTTCRLPQPMMGDTLPDCNRVEQEELDGRGQYAPLGED